MKLTILVICILIFGGSRKALGQTESKDFADILKKDSGPLCANFIVTKDLTVFCLEEPYTKTLYQFEYGMTQHTNAPPMKKLNLSVYDPVKKQFNFKMSGLLFTDGPNRLARLNDPGFRWDKTYSILNDKHSDEAFFLSMLIYDLRYEGVAPKDDTVPGKFLLSIYYHMGMTPIGEQRLIPTNLPPDNR